MSGAWSAGLALSLLATIAPAGLYDSWSYKAAIQFSGYNKSEALTNFPALVVLGTNISGFAYSQFLSGTSDLAFTADAAGLTNLNYEIDSWNANGQSYVWVQVPALTSNTTVTAWWGAPGQTAPACTTNGATWDSRYCGVMHLGESGAPYNDSTTNRNNSASGTYPTQTNGVWGKAQCFNGTVSGTSGSQITLQRNVISNATTFTVEHWVNETASQKGRNLFSNYHGWVTGIDDSNSDKVKFYFGDGGGGTLDSDVPLVPGTWTHVVVTYGTPANLAQIYINGVPHGSRSGALGGPLPAASALGYLIGNALQYFQGSMDEVRVSNIARSSNYVWACYMNQASNTPAFQTYGAAASVGPPSLINLAPSNVVSGSAVFNGQITSTGSAPVTAAAVYWGTTDGGPNAAAWANTNVFSGGPWSVGDVLATNITLTAGQNYFYTYCASNANGAAMATPSQYFISGELTAQATDALLGGSLTDTATVVISRPATCTSGAITVYYTLGGAATNGVNYTNSPASGSLVIPAGQTDASITLTPVSPLNFGAPMSVTVNLAPGAYVVGVANSVTCTVQQLFSQSYTWAKVSGSWSAATNWTPAGGPPASAGDSGAITSGTATADADLGAPLSYPTITVSAGGTLAVSATTLNTPVTFNGGALSGGNTLAGTLTLASGGLTVGAAGSPTLGGPMSGPGSLTVNGGVTLNGVNSNWTGNTTIPAGKQVTLYTNSVMALGCGGTVINRGTINADASQPYATNCAPPALTLDGGTFSFPGFGPGPAGLNSGIFPYAMSVTTNGGTIIGSIWWPNNQQFTGSLNVNGLLTAGVTRGAGNSYAFTGPMSGTGTVQTLREDNWNNVIAALGVSHPTNTFGGNWLVNGGLRVLADQALGTAQVVRVVSSGITGYGGNLSLWGGLSLEAKQSYPAGRQPLIRVESTGAVYIATDNTVTQSVDVTLAGGELSGRWAQSSDPSGYNYCVTGTVTLTANSYLGGTVANGNQIVQSRITGDYSLTRRSTGADTALSYSIIWPGWMSAGNFVKLNGAVTLANPQNDFSGGLGVNYATLAIGTPGAQGPGPLSVLATNATLAFTGLSGARDWTITNNLSGIGAVKVESGTNRLTLAGGTLNPGTDGVAITTNSTGVLTVNGRFAFAATNGAVATLAIDVAGTNGVAGVDYDQLVVTAGDAALAASLANGALAVNTAMPGRQLIGTPPITILTASNADFRAASFGSVVFNGAAGKVLYNNGNVQVQFMAAGTVLVVQ